ncbi:MAG TPA: NAD-dependent deacylase [Candidatus Syntrophosphaera sp.]|nr:NAD-dependent deacylase [Candidatus Syntrophosphaera sp.]
MIKVTKNTNLLVLTGAGISAESGLRTFRDSDGLWENHRVEDVATPEAWHRDPKLVWRFYKARWEQSKQAAPNPGHLALARLEDWLGDNFHLITQNVDGLHTAAGNTRVIEMHGALSSCLCTKCGVRLHLDEVDMSPELPACPKCTGRLRPDIVWFGEIPYRLPEIDILLQNCDVFLVVGTSGVVYPAAGFVQMARYLGAKTISVNLHPSEGLGFFDEFHQGRAGEILPRLVDKWMAE